MSMTTGQMEQWIKHQIKTTWDESPEKKLADRRANIFFLVGLAIVLLCFIAFYYFGPEDPDVEGSPVRWPPGMITAGLTLFVGPFLLLVIHGVKEGKARKLVEDRARQARAADLREEEREFAKQARVNKDVDFASLWSLNQDRIDYYHEIAITQARNSFRSGQIATITGFVAVIILGIIAASSSGASAISVGVIGVAGAALSGYIGATFMKAQADASAQLRQFFAQPVEFARLLGAERLLDSLTPTEKTAAVNAIIKATMQDTDQPFKVEDPKVVAPAAKPAGRLRWPWARQ